MTTAQALSAALSIVPAGTVLRVDYRGACRTEPSLYVGELAGFGGESFTLKTTNGPRRFVARADRLFGVEIVSLGKVA